MRKVTTALLIDDDAAFRLALQGALRRRGVRAITAATAEEGVVLAEDASRLAEPPELVVLDQRMPGTQGISAVAALRKLCPSSAIVMLTGYGDIPLTVAAMREGADTLLTKPIDADRLLEEAASIADREAPTGPSRTYRLDDLERQAIDAALSDSGGVVATAAKMLGIDRRTLQRKLRRQT